MGVSLYSGSTPAIPASVLFKYAMSGPVRLASLAVRGAAMVSSRFWISWMRRTGLAGFTVASDGFLGWGEQVGLDAHQFPQLVRQVELVGRVPVVDPGFNL